MYVFIAHDDRPAYRRALRTLANVFGELNDACLEMHPLPWRFDDLADARRQRFAMADASKSTIVVFSTSTAKELPEAIQTWLPASLSRQRDSTGAVVAMFGEPGQIDGPDSPRYQFVRNASRTAGWSFFEPTLSNSSVSA